ncbi:enhancer of rudimentary family protein [Pelomyxa schiedti]|nr:enhancer of rudimentary family protein [Pelomyxa schiedti]
MATSASATEDNRHTIVLVQFHSAVSSRVYYDFPSISAAAEAVCRLFEHKLQQSQPNVREIRYDVADLLKWIDNLTDLSCLVYDPRVFAYLPYPKDWVKKRVQDYMRSLGVETSL